MGGMGKTGMSRMIRIGIGRIRRIEMRMRNIGTGRMGGVSNVPSQGSNVRQLSTTEKPCRHTSENSLVR
jgi:hypothetical protein